MKLCDGDNPGVNKNIGRIASEKSEVSELELPAEEVGSGEWVGNWAEPSLPKLLAPCVHNTDVEEVLLGADDFGWVKGGGSAGDRP